jgi:type I restriction enzyme S subunit
MTVYKTEKLSNLLAVSIGGIWGVEAGEAEVDVSVVRVTELKAHGRIDPSSAVTRSVKLKQLASRELQEGDLLLEKSGGGPNSPVGRVGYFSQEGTRTVCSNFMQLMRPDSTKILPKYLFYFLDGFHSNGGTIPMQTATTNIRNIKTPQYMDIDIPVPSIDEQHKIVELLEDHFSRLDAALDDVNQGLKRVKQFRRSLLQATFHEREDSKLCYLGEVVDVKTGKIDANRAVSNGKYPFFTCARDISRIDEAPFHGKVVLVAGNGDLNVKYYEGNFNAYQRTYILKSKNEEILFPKYLFWFMEHFIFELRTLAIGTTVKYIKMGNLIDAKMPLPSLNVQKQIVIEIEKSLSFVDQSEETFGTMIRGSQNLRRALLKSAFLGQLTKEVLSV